MTLAECSGGDEKGCVTTAVPNGTLVEGADWLEQQVVAGFRVWQIVFMCIAGVLALVVFLCCCIRFRIPRTKQEIEADYMRKKITRKFKKHLKFIQNSEMDDMDLKRALDRVRAEFKSETESLAPSEALSGATLSSGGCLHPQESSTPQQLPPDATDNTYCKGSDILIGGDSTTQQEQASQNTLGAKFASLVENTLFKFRSKKNQEE